MPRLPHALCVFIQNTRGPTLLTSVTFISLLLLNTRMYMYLFLIDAKKKNYHKFISLRENKCIILQLWGEASGPQTGFWDCLWSCLGLPGRTTALFLPPTSSHLHSLACGPASALQRGNPGLSLLSVLCVYVLSNANLPASLLDCPWWPIPLGSINQMMQNDLHITAFLLKLWNLSAMSGNILTGARN